MYSTEKKHKQRFIANITTDVLPTYTVDSTNLIHYFSCSLAWYKFINCVQLINVVPHFLMLINKYWTGTFDHQV
jgi:hypothetical protein